MGEKELEFTQEDEETLVMFATQAALVIANARRHRDEQRARADLETLVNTTPVGVLVFDARTGGVTSVNREARRIVSDLCAPGGSAEQLLEVLTFRRADGREVSLQEFPLAQGLMTGETVRAEEIVLKAPDGRSVTTLVNATPIFSEDGEVESVVVTMQDMTPMEDLERRRAEFLGMVSHELRTPLAAIKGSADTLLEASAALDPAEMTQFFRIIRDQSENMRHLIGDLLDVARIETGTLPVSPEPVEVTVLVDEARSRFQSGGGRNNLQIDLPPDLPRVLADRRRVVQVLNNLLSNAARHSSELSPIRVAAVRDGVHVAFSVADYGVGVPAERLPHLFRKFSRLDGEERGREVGGSGLGLAICKGIVEAHGGRIRAESDGPGLGSRFTFTLPAVKEPARRASARPRPRPRKEPEPTRILCVDDDPQTLRYVRDALTRAGHAPIVTGDPEEVPRLMAEQAPHLVLLDLVLPGSDGIELMQAIREIADVPVIFLSAYGQDEVVARAFDLGAADYVVKPLLANGAGGPDPGRPAQAGGAGAGPALPALRAGRVDRRLLPAQGDAGRTPGRAHHHRVPDAGRAFGQRRAAADPPASAATRLGTGPGRKHRAGAQHRREAAPQAGRRRRQPGLHLRRAQRRLPHGAGRGNGGGDAVKQADATGHYPGAEDAKLTTLIDIEIPQIARELHLAGEQVAATVGLLDDGATAPFIARYRKEHTGSLDEVAITSIRDRLAQLRELRESAGGNPGFTGKAGSAERGIAEGPSRCRNQWQSSRIPTCPTGPGGAPGPPSPGKGDWSPWRCASGVRGISTSPQPLASTSIPKRGWITPKRLCVEPGTSSPSGSAKTPPRGGEFGSCSGRRALSPPR